MLQEMKSNSHRRVKNGAFLFCAIKPFEQSVAFIVKVQRLVEAANHLVSFVYSNYSNILKLMCC